MLLCVYMEYVLCKINYRRSQIVHTSYVPALRAGALCYPGTHSFPLSACPWGEVGARWGRTYLGLKRGRLSVCLCVIYPSATFCVARLRTPVTDRQLSAHYSKINDSNNLCVFCSRSESIRPTCVVIEATATLRH